MRGTTVAAFAALLHASACSSASDEPACPDIVGNYKVAVSRLSGTCDPALDRPEGTIGIAKAGDGSFTAVVPGVEGGCPGTFDAKSCHFSSACQFSDASTNAVIGTSNLDYTFTRTGFTGSSAAGLRPPAVKATCDVTYRQVGTKL